MSNRHLPAGQHMAPAQGVPPYAPGPGGMPPPPVDMNAGMPPPPGPPAHQHHHHHQGGHQGGGHHNMGPGPRRRQHHPHPHPPPPQHPPHPGIYAPQYHPMNQQMYGGYMPYGGPQQVPYGMPPQYQNSAMHNPAAYMPYQGYSRSPPAMPQYTPMAGVTVPQNYHRQSQLSPALSTPYQPPPAPVPVPPETPSSTHSSQMLPPETPPTPLRMDPMPTRPPPSEPSPPLSVTMRTPFRPPLPWLSRPDEPFPTLKPKTRSRKRHLNAESEAVSLPIEQHEGAVEQNEQNAQAVAAATSTPSTQAPETEAQPSAPKQAVPSTDGQRSRSNTSTSATPKKPTNQAQPANLLVPAVPQASKSPTADKTQDNKQSAVQQEESNPEDTAEGERIAAPVAKPPPSSWANLFAKSSAPAKNGTNGTSAEGASTNGNSGSEATGTSSLFPNKPNPNSAAEAIRAYKVDSGNKVSFIEPRGLINTGNMCYMNSVLQVLMFCAPFYDFLDQVGKRAAHSFKSDTPLVDAMIMFMNEFKVLKSASSVEQLHRALKGEDLEKFGEPFTPDFVYEAIRQLDRFASMRRGHQQDAEEFLGFLLQSLDDECTLVMGTSLSDAAARAQAEASGSDGQANPSGDWMEVGRKQKAAVTRSSGANVSTPINKIFGGFLRSEFRVPGLKDSITTEPYQPLQLDIGAPDVRSVVDALRGLTRPERLQGDFNSPRGKDVQATKQVFIEALPPVLILHLKRFQFDAEGHGTVKIWKHIDYPLDLEIPREALSRQKRQTLTDGEMPRYKLISVVYHHGKNASGGHYTVDVRRQDGQDWLRLDDTVLRRVHSKDVAEVGSGEDARDTVRKENASAGASSNRFDAMNDDEAGDDDGWKQVTTTANGNRRWSNVVNGTGNTGARGKQTKESVKDNKVAYLLFYQRV